jgi:hypothetical protein
MPMHQTTVRFAPDVWATLEDEAKHLGVSVAQYIREASVARLAYGLGRRNELGLEDAIREAGSLAAEAEWGDRAAGTQAQREVARSRDMVSSSEALWAQGKLARERAQELRGELAIHQHPHRTVDREEQ